MSQVTAAELDAFLRAEFPQSRPERYTIETIDDGFVCLRRRVDADDLRPGGTISGPVLMAVGDMAAYLVVLAAIGLVPLAVTTDLTAHFLRRPAPGADLIAEARLLKCGQKLAVAEVVIRSDGLADGPVAHVVATYAIPPGRT
ncbi:MAG: PaaI family thioesterase [bacterium]|nr:PaaI family thioesterase [bacterium]